MTTVDVWAQIPTRRMAEAPWMKTLLRWTRRSRDSVMPTVESTLQAMDEAAIEIAILSAWHAPEGSLISNEEVAGMVAQAPDRFRALATFDLSQPAMENVAQIRRWLGDSAFVGVRIVPWLWGLPPNDRRYYPIYAACNDAGKPLCTQIGHTGPLRGSETGRLIPYLEDVLLDFPDLTVVGGHVGFPWVEEVVSLTLKFPNFCVDTSAYALHRLPDEFVRYLKSVGQDRVMFGTNWPMLTPAQCLRDIDSLGLSDQQRHAFLSQTARRIFKL